MSFPAVPEAAASVVQVYEAVKQKRVPVLMCESGSVKAFEPTLREAVFRVSRLKKNVWGQNSLDATQRKSQMYSGISV